MLYFEDGLYRFEHGDLPEWLGNESKTSNNFLRKRARQSLEIADLIAEPKVKDGELSAKLTRPALAEINAPYREPRT